MFSLLLPKRFDFHSKHFLDSISEELLLTSDGKLYLDFNDVEYLDSSGLGSLLLLRSKAKQYGSEIFIINVSDTINDILMLSHFDKFFSILKS